MPILSTRALGIAALTVLVLASGCKKAQDAAVERAIERATGNTVDVDKDGHEMTIDTKEGQVRIATAQDGDNLALPADFPSDIYLPAQHKVASVMDMAGMQMVNLNTKAALPSVSADVERQMQVAGWKREMAMQADGSATLMYSKDKRQVVYQFVKDESGGTQLAIRASGKG